MNKWTPIYGECPFLHKAVGNKACGQSLQPTSFCYVQENRYSWQILWQDIHDNSWGKWRTLSLFFITFTANPLDYNSCFAWSLSPVAGFPNLLLDLISLDSIIETKFLHVWTESNHNEVHLQLLLSYLLVNNLTLMLSYIFWHKIWVFRIPNLHFWRYF